jgi:hypothetical protein
LPIADCGLPIAERSECAQSDDQSAINNPQSTICAPQ